MVLTRSVTGGHAAEPPSASNPPQDPPSNVTVAAGQQSVKAESPKSPTQSRRPKKTSKASTSKSMKARRLAEAQEEIAKRKLELAEARLAKIQAIESDDEADSDSETDNEAAETSRARVEEWIDTQESKEDVSAPTPPQPSPPKEPETNQINIADLTAALLATAQALTPKPTPTQVLRQLPTTDLPTFNGAHTEWLNFKLAYEDLAPYGTSRENTARLRRALKGKAREEVNSLLVAVAKPEEIMRALENRFGRPHTIAQLEYEKLENIQKPTDSARDVCVFANKIQNTVAVLYALGEENYCHHPKILKGLVEKLTPALRYRWYDFRKKIDNKKASLEMFKSFITEEAENCREFAPPENITSDDAPPSRQHTAHRAHVTTERKPTEKKPSTCLVCGATAHPIKDCETFKKADSDGRWAIAKEKRLCFRCLGFKSYTHRCKSKFCNENDCKKTHHRLLHYEARQDPPTEKSETETVAATHTPRITNTYLKIVPVRIAGAAGFVDTHALLDDGSTVTLIDAEIASQVGADGPIDTLSIETVSGRDRDSTSRRVTLQLRGRNNKSFDIEARTIERLYLTPQTVSKADVINAPHLRELSSSVSYEEAKPTLLIGQDNWQLLIAEEVRKGAKNQPAASLTPLGWVLHGSSTRSLGRQVHYISHVTDQATNDSLLDEQMKRFFSLESLCIQPKKTRADPDELALQQLQKHTKERIEGGYETSLIWKNDAALPNNYEVALKRMISTEKKIDREPLLRAKYEENIEALLRKGYAEPAPPVATPGRTWYLPHFPVLHPAKPGKVRLVFDAAARYAGTALNDHLLSGPDLLQSLPGVLMRFRQHEVAMAADIEEMFLRIGIIKEDRDVLRFLWRDHRREGPPQEYRMKSVIFGAACSPCIALYVKNFNAEKHRENYPEAAEAIVTHHYMDDYLQSFPTKEEALRVANDVREIHRQANFNLCKWASNRSNVLEAISNEPQATTRSDVTLADVKEEKVLGLTWRTETDTLGFNLNFARAAPEIVNGQRTPTKREALTTVMSLFDPLGFASPITIQAKRLLQDTWRTGTAWDEPLHDSLQEHWHQWIIDLKKLEEVKIPRCHPCLTNAASRQLHIFVDASESAYAAAAYWRVETDDGRIYVSLAAAKAKVAPLKVTSIPRLELQAAVLGSRLGKTVADEYQVTIARRCYWSDSKTVLAWLRAGPRAFKPYVAHRVAEIEEETTVNEWRWVPSQHNVADDATRAAPADFTATHRWFTGPAFLYSEETEWPQEAIDTTTKTETGEEKVFSIAPPTVNTLAEALPDIKRFSSWLRLIRATARVLQFVELLKSAKHRINYSRTKRRTDNDPQWQSTPAAARNKTSVRRSTRTASNPPPKYIPIEATYVQRAEQLWIRNSQQQAFKTEINALRSNQPLPNDSRLKPIATYIDDDDVIRLKSRIAAAADVTVEQKEPAVIDGDHPYTQLYIDWVHRKLAHGSTEVVVNEVRQHYWVLRLRPTTKQIVKRCLPCRIKKAQPASPPTGDHPYSRLGHHKRPFTYVGLDYFGPVTVTVGRRHEKRYVALFTCLTTRALHLEIASSLSSDSAVMALRRFIARRGCPAEIYSDNGTNMHGADKELRDALADESSKHAIRWRFICPSSPFMGGCWERLVKSVKIVLERVLHERYPHEECLHTLLLEAEYIVNSRPLTHVSVDPTDEEALTPNHFLLGGSARTPPPGTFTDDDLASKAHWRRAQRLADHFWSRWVKEYLPELQHRREPHGRGRPINIGDLVLIADGNLPRNVWPRGVVTALYPGPDGTTRVVDVRTRGSTLRRPTKKIVVLPPTDVPAPEKSTDDAAAVRRENMCGTVLK